MSQLTTTRRSLLASAPAVAALAAIPAAVLAHDADATIKAAWQRRQAAYAAYKAEPTDQPVEPGEIETPEEKRLWAIIDEAEETIRSARAVTLEGVTIQLWVSLYHSVTHTDQDDAITRGDFAAVEALDRELDWNVRLALAAMRSLRSIGG